MIPVLLARALRTAGLRWKPASGDRFLIDQAEVGDEVFTVSDMTVEAHTYPSGTVLGFNGTTEWALDSVSLDEALWLPTEGQLRSLLRGAFRSLRVEDAGDGEGADAGGPVFVVAIEYRGEAREFRGASADEAYGEALLHVVGSTLA